MPSQSSLEANGREWRKEQVAPPAPREVRQPGPRSGGLSAATAALPAAGPPCTTAAPSPLQRSALRSAQPCPGPRTAAHALALRHPAMPLPRSHPAPAEAQAEGTSCSACAADGTLPAAALSIVPVTTRTGRDDRGGRPLTGRSVLSSACLWCNSGSSRHLVFSHFTDPAPLTWKPRSFASL